jgi:L-cysteine S-thiosulfotransferase
MFRSALLNLVPPWPSIALCLAFAACTGHAFAQGTPEQGFRIITTGTLGNCVACHALPGQRDIPSTFGPSFDKIGLRLPAAALRQWVTDARLLKPDTLMPPFGTTQGTRGAVRAQAMLSEEQIDHVVAALLTLR